MTKSFNSKSDYRNIVVDIMNYIKPYCSEGQSRILSPDSNCRLDEAMARKGFSNMLWAAAPFIKGGGRNLDIEKLYRLGTINGTNPHSSEYWGVDSDIEYISNEMVSVAYGLLINSDIIMELFTKNERQDIVNWLYNINFYNFGMNEKQFFVILVNSALKLLGRPYDNNRLNSAFEAIEHMYIDNGWYGLNDSKDYNITLAIQFYSLIYAKTLKGYDEPRSNIYVKRAEELLFELYNNKLLHNINDDAALISFCSACINADINVANMDIMNMVKKAMAGCSNKIINTLEYPNIDKANKKYYEKANDFLADYMKSFLVLTLPEEHKFWNVS